jgi:hypothetical protein
MQVQRLAATPARIGEQLLDDRVERLRQRGQAGDLAALVGGLA